MRTTIDFPDDVLRRAKARAALNGMKLKELITRYVEKGLRESDEPGEPVRRKRSEPPLNPKAMTGKPIPAFSNAQLAEIEMEEDLDKLRRSYGR